MSFCVRSGWQASWCQRVVLAVSHYKGILTWWNILPVCTTIHLLACINSLTYNYTCFWTELIHIYWLHVLTAINHRCQNGVRYVALQWALPIPQTNWIGLGFISSGLQLWIMKISQFKMKILSLLKITYLRSFQLCFLLNIFSGHIQLKYRCAIKHSDHMRPS